MNPSKSSAAETLELNLRDGVDTTLGGVLYLINLMRQLGIPAEFEPDWGLSGAASPWGLLELLGRGLLAGLGDHLIADPIWAALCEIDGRKPGTLPGDDYQGPESAQLPATWADVPDPSGAPPLPESDLLLAGINPHLLRWLNLVIPVLRHRIRTLVPLPEAAMPALIAEVCQVRARLYATRSHIDLVIRMDTASVPVRISGLDQSPGWLPDFGRVVQFHFK